MISGYTLCFKVTDLVLIPVKLATLRRCAGTGTGTGNCLAGYEAEFTCNKKKIQKDLPYTTGTYLTRTPD
jgi:hypothetical protein